MGWGCQWTTNPSGLRLSKSQGGYLETSRSVRSDRKGVCRDIKGRMRLLGRQGVVFLWFSWQVRLPLGPHNYDQPTNLPGF